MMGSSCYVICKNEMGWDCWYQLMLISSATSASSCIQSKILPIGSRHEGKEAFSDGRLAEMIWERELRNRS